MAANVPEPLDDDAAPLERNPEVPAVLHHHVHDAAPGGLLAPEGAAERHRLAGHRRRRVAVAARIFVQDPRHHLRVGVDVGRGDVAVGAQHDGDALGEAAGEPLELEVREPPRIYRDAALRPPEGDVHQGRLPRHDGRQAEDLVVVRLGMVADAALARAAGAVVLDPVPGEHLDAPVVHPHRDLDLHLPERRHENAAHVVFEVDEVGGAVELAHDDGFPRHRRTRGAGGAVGRGGSVQGRSGVSGRGGGRPGGPPGAGLPRARARRWCGSRAARRP